MWRRLFLFQGAKLLGQGCWALASEPLVDSLEQVVGNVQGLIVALKLSGSKVNPKDHAPCRVHICWCTSQARQRDTPDTVPDARDGCQVGTCHLIDHFFITLPYNELGLWKCFLTDYCYYNLATNV